MLVGTDGLPARHNNIASEAWLRARPDVITLPKKGTVEDPSISENQYPLRLAWDGVLVDDPDDEADIVRRVHDVFQLIWRDRADAIEQEACEILGVKDLRAYFRNPRSFFESHIKRYSKSRRKAPIYWLLQSDRRNYGLWLYYHRLGEDTLFKALEDYVNPKLVREEQKLAALRQDLVAGTTGGATRRKQERDAEEQEALVLEIERFRDTLRGIADLRLTPDLDDGVLLSIAPLHALVPWREAKRAWQELVAGKYTWSSMSKQMRERGLVGPGRA